MAMVEQAMLHARRTSKRSFSTGETRSDVEAKRRSVDVHRNESSSYGGNIVTPSYPVSSLYQSHRDPEASNGSQPSIGQASTSKTEIIEEGYPGQYDHFRDYPLTHPHPGVDTGRRNEVEMSFPAPQTKRNRFNLSRYQLDEEDIPALPAVEPEEKPNRFKTQRERLMLAAADSEEEEEESVSVSSDSQSQSQSRSQDSCYMSQRERLRRFSSEQSRHVVIPNEWEGEQRLQEFVTFGNIEAALRPLGLMMARAALVSDSVTTRQRRSSSAGPSRCHTSLSNPRTS